MRSTHWPSQESTTLKKGSTPKECLRYGRHSAGAAVFLLLTRQNEDADDIGTDESCFSALFRYRLSDGRSHQQAGMPSDTAIRPMP